MEKKEKIEKKPDGYKNINSSAYRIMDKIKFKKPEEYKNINSSSYKIMDNDIKSNYIIRNPTLY